MQILLTGAQGFLGKIIRKQLCDHSIATLGNSSLNDYITDLSQCPPVLPNSIDLVVHTAGKAHVIPKTINEAQAFWDVNWQGTLNLLRGIENSLQVLKGFVLTSTVSVYGLVEGENIKESTPLMGTTPYALSKIKAEEAVQEWCTKHGVPYLILRLPLVVGPEPKGNLSKMIRGISAGTYFRVAHGEAQKSMVMGTDVARLIESWAQCDTPRSGIYNLTDGHHPTFFELENAILQRLGKKFIPSLPLWIAKALGRVGNLLPFFPINSATIKKITSKLTFSDEKAVQELGWSPTLVLEGLNFLDP